MALLTGADCVPGNERFMPPTDWWAGYVDGSFQSYPSLVRLANGARPVMAYTVLGHPIPVFTVPKLIVDVESGNPVDPIEVDNWFRQQLGLGWPMEKLAVYASSSRWDEIDRDVAAAGIKLTADNRAVAQYDGVASLNTIRHADGSFYPPDHFGLKQYSDKGGPVVSANGSHAYDLNVATESFIAVGSTGNQPPGPGDDIVSITCGNNQSGVFHVLVERQDGRVEYTWQDGKDNSWQGGKKGVSPAGFSLFAPAPDKK